MYDKNPPENGGFVSNLIGIRKSLLFCRQQIMFMTMFRSSTAEALPYWQILMNRYSSSYRNMLQPMKLTRQRSLQNGCGLILTERLFSHNKEANQPWNRNKNCHAIPHGNFCKKQRSGEENGKANLWSRIWLSDTGSTHRK